MLSLSGQRTPMAGSNLFWASLEKNCGKAFEGEVVTAPDNDTTFAGKKLVMHIRSCEAGRIRIPFHVGENYSRTWVLTLYDSLVQLKHDHRHADGSEDRVTQYGGMATNTGTPTTQYFPADQYTVDLLPTAASNVWWIDMVPGEHFTYNLRRIGTDRQYSIRFNLQKPIPAPPAPWGWKD
ncbi:MAG TPA: hypothetical protein VK907_02710 [Phnomibacter sp.]|nr:hypothetical protein [Phnomibacter sp.]